MNKLKKKRKIFKKIEEGVVIYLKFIRKQEKLTLTVSLADTFHSGILFALIFLFAMEENEVLFKKLRN